MSAPSPVALSAAATAAAALSPWRYPCPVCHRENPVTDAMTLTPHRNSKRSLCNGSDVLFDTEIILCRPWLALARTVVARLRLSPAVSAFERVADHLLDTTPADSLATRPDTFAEHNLCIDRWQEGFVAAAHAAPMPPVLPKSIAMTHGRRDLEGINRVALEAVRAALDPIAPPGLLTALDALRAELAAEILGAARWYVTPHAVERYAERFAPDAADEEIRAAIHRLAAVADVATPVERGIGWSSGDHPGVRLVVADNTVVTVLDVGRWRRADSGRGNARAMARIERAGASHAGLGNRWNTMRGKR